MYPEGNNILLSELLKKLVNFGWETVYVLLSVLLLLICILFIVPVIIPILVYRYLLKIFIRCYSSELGKMVTTRGSYFTNVDPIYVQPKMNILGCLVLKGRVPLKTFWTGLNDSWIEKRLPAKSAELVVPELQQYPISVSGFYFWKWDRDFRIENHVREYDWRAEFKTLDDSTILSINNRLLTQAYPEKRSPWEILVLHTGSDAGEPLTYLILRTHHSLADGSALLYLISHCCQASADKYINQVKPSPAQTVEPGTNFSELFRAPYTFVKQGLTIRDNNKFMAPAESLSWELNALVSDPIPVPFIKGIRKAHNVSFSAVIFSAVSGAIRSYMLENAMAVPDHIHCFTPLPIPGHSNKLRNYSSFGVLQLPVGLPCAQARLRFLGQHFSELKKSAFPLVSFYLMSLVGALPAPLTRCFMGNKPISAHLSNIGGPVQAVDICGHELESMWFSPANAGIGVTCLSYNDKIKLAVSVDKNILPLDISIKSLMDKILEELNILNSGTQPVFVPTYL